MHTTSQFEIQQEATRLEGAVKTFFDNFSVGTLLNSCSIKKLKGGLSAGYFRSYFPAGFPG